MNEFKFRKKVIVELTKAAKENTIILHDLAVKMSQKIEKISDEEMSQATIDYRVEEEEVYDCLKVIDIAINAETMDEFLEKAKGVWEQTTSGALYNLLKEYLKPEKNTDDNSDRA
jgi:hypothetical protein